MSITAIARTVQKEGPRLGEVVPFERDALAAGAWEATRNSWSMEPERRLMLAVLEDAVETLRKYGKRTDPRSRRLVAEVLEWMDRPDALGYPWSFREVVDATVGMRGIEAEELAISIRRRFPDWDEGHRVTLMKLKQVDRVVLPKNIRLSRAANDA